VKWLRNKHQEVRTERCDTKSWISRYDVGLLCKYFFFKLRNNLLCAVIWLESPNYEGERIKPLTGNLWGDLVTDSFAES